MVSHLVTLNSWTQTKVTAVKIDGFLSSGNFRFMSDDLLSFPEISVIFKKSANDFKLDASIFCAAGRTGIGLDGLGISKTLGLKLVR